MGKSLISFVFLFLFGSGFLYGQDRIIDSIEAVVKKSSGVERYEAQVALSRQYFYDNEYPRALALAEQAQSFALSAGDTTRIVQSGRMIGQINNYMFRSEAAIKVLESVRPVAERNKLYEDLIKIYNNLGIANMTQAKYDVAMKYYYDALAISDKSEERVNKAFTLSAIAALNLRMANYQEALTNSLASEQISLEEKDYYEIERAQLGAGIAYNALHDYANGERYFKKALESCGEDCKVEILVAALEGYGYSRLQQNDLKEARKYFSDAIALASKSKSTIMQFADGMFQLSRVEFAEGNEEKGRELLFEVEKIAVREKLRSLTLSCYQYLAESYDRQNDYANSTIFLKKYITLKDSIYNNDVMDNLAQTKSDFEQRENLATIKARELTIEEQRKFNYSIMVIAGMAVLFGVFLFRNNKIMTAMNKKLTAAQDVIFEQNKKLELRNRELDLMVEKKTEELKMVNLSLRQMNDELDTFINKTAEDIRAPLASLKGICNVALKDIQDQAPLVYLHKINSTTELLNSILKRLLAINKINQSRISMSTIDLKSLVEGVLAVQQKKGLPPNLTIRKNISTNAILNTDRELLSVVLENSIDNAVKFCRNSPRAEHFIEISVKPTRNGRISFSVIDNGLGANQVTLEEYDDIFMQTNDDSGSDRKDLYFVKTAAQKIGGKVHMNKTIEGYNELSVTI